MESAYGLDHSNRPESSRVDSQREKTVVLSNTPMPASAELESEGSDTGERLDFIRRQIIRIFYSLDSEIHGQGHKWEPFRERLARLTDEGRIPAGIAVSIKLINSFRNLVVYENYELSADELRLVEEVWQVIIGWWTRSRTHRKAQYNLPPPSRQF